MNLDVDFLISFFEKHSTNKNKKEIGEQDAGAGGGGSTSGGKGYPAVPKWDSLYQTKRGKANMLGLKGEKWETGMARGVANQYKW